LSFRRVTVVGLGLIGGSFALALKKVGVQVVGVDEAAVVDAARARGAVDSGGPDLEEGVRGSDLVVLATPISVILDHIRRLAPVLRPGTLVTDVGSTKRRILARSSELPDEVFFVGGHPMAGKETSGLDAADAELFRGAPWCLVPREGTPGAALQKLENLVTALGARPVAVDAESHDRAVAVVSHVPQVLALVLAHQAASVENALSLSGPAFRSLKRLAESPFSVWRDILETNEDMIKEALSEFERRLGEARDAVPRLDAHFALARTPDHD